ncbi:hypothetical protein Ga0609869_000843 [Rhodovulum iodosum]|uniref:Arginine transporter n=1 Tax=Rhodovulum iodosum TaxID=68291 RepID=A0ABV3XQ76_9RHOB|nr:hypothetical protein [Rhodovulum robiginosum]RSK39434.1 hypothetical protein EJA01_01270 [Rhodovulum robiginosum]
MKKLAYAAALSVLAVSAAQAGPIERACLQSDRSNGSRSLCGCIQDAANLTLTGADQRFAAKFFRDPHQAQVVRQSDNTSHEAFWQRYKRFGTTAEAFCG